MKVIEALLHRGRSSIREAALPLQSIEPEVPITPREHQPRYEKEVSAVIKTGNGSLIMVDLSPTNLRVVLPRENVDGTQVLNALHQAFPNSELYTEPPSHFSPRRAEDMKKRGFLGGIRQPLEGDSPAAFWLAVNQDSWLGRSYVAFDGERIENYEFLHEGLYIQTEGEVWSPEGYPPISEGDAAWALQTHTRQEVPGLQTAQQKLGEFLGNLFEGENVASLGVESDGMVIFVDEKHYPGYHEIPIEEQRFTSFSGLEANDITAQRVKQELDMRHFNGFSYGSYRSYAFELGDREHVVYHRSGRAQYPHHTMKVKSYSNNELPLSQVNAEIERMRWM